MNWRERIGRLPWRQILAAFSLIAVFGVARMPFEQAVEVELREAGFREWSPNIDNRDQLGQAGFAGALGGFRSLVALFYDVKAHTAREDKEWAEVEKFRNVTTTLQPRYWKHWDMATWDMAWNAFAYYRGIAEDYRDEYRGWEAEKVTMPLFLEKGIDFATRGMKWLPDSYRMPQLVGDIHSTKYEDKCAAIEWYLQASQKPDAPAYVYRKYAHHLAICPGREEQAYEVVSALYNGGQRTPTVRHDMEDLEDHFARQRAAGKTREELERATVAAGASHLDLAALAMHFSEVEKDDQRAAEVYAAVVKLPDAPVFYRKKWALFLARDEGRSGLAYRALKALYLEDPDALRPEDEIALRDLEDRLDIGAEERVTRPAR